MHTQTYASFCIRDTKKRGRGRSIRIKRTSSGTQFRLMEVHTQQGQWNICFSLKNPTHTICGRKDWPSMLTWVRLTPAMSRIVGARSIFSTGAWDKQKHKHKHRTKITHVWSWGLYWLNDNSRFGNDVGVRLMLRTVGWQTQKLNNACILMQSFWLHNNFSYIKNMGVRLQDRGMKHKSSTKTKAGVSDWLNSHYRNTVCSTDATWV